MSAYARVRDEVEGKTQKKKRPNRTGLDRTYRASKLAILSALSAASFALFSSLAAASFAR